MRREEQEEVVDVTREKSRGVRTIRNTSNTDPAAAAAAAEEEEEVILIRDGHK